MAFATWNRASSRPSPACSRWATRGPLCLLLSLLVSLGAARCAFGSTRSPRPHRAAPAAFQPTGSASARSVRASSKDRVTRSREKSSAVSPRNAKAPAHGAALHNAESQKVGKRMPVGRAASVARASASKAKLGAHLPAGSHHAYAVRSAALPQGHSRKRNVLTHPQVAATRVSHATPSAPTGQRPPYATTPASTAFVSRSILAKVEAAGPGTSATGTKSQPQQRVEGFGAEGATLPAANSFPERPTVKASLPTQKQTAANPELAGVAQPSSAELTQEALRPMVLPALFGTDGRLLVPAALRGTREILVHQNLMADEAGLERIHDDEHLRRLYADHQLVMFSESASLRVNSELPSLRRTARPWTVHFASDTARAFYERFHQPLQVNSAVRTVAYQLRLQRSNGNAAAIAGETASPHLTGQAIDFGKRGMSLTEIAWMRAYLLPLMMAGKIDVEEEFQQACFHISVYRSYVPTRPASVPRIELADVPSAGLRHARGPLPEMKPTAMAPDASSTAQEP